MCPGGEIVGKVFTDGDEKGVICHLHTHGVGDNSSVHMQMW